MNTVTKPATGVQLATKCKCYTSAMAKPSQFIRKPTHIIVHSTGCNNPNLKRYVGPDDGVLGKNTANNHWNREANTGKGANAFIGKAADGTPMIYQTLPWDMRPWLSGSGNKGNANNFAVQFEMCEDNLTNEGYWRQVRAQAVRLCAWLCQEYGIPAANIWGHYEAHAYGYANNHGDPRNWMSKFKDSMDLFRADVRAMLDGEIVPEPTEPVAPPTADEVIAAAVQTGSSGLNMREGPGTGYKSLGTIPRGKSLDVYEISGSWARVRYQNVVVWVSANYLTIDFYDVDPEEPMLAPIGIAVQDKSNGLNIRTGRGTNYKSLGLIPKYTDLDVYEIQGTWALVQWGNIQGWCSKNYLTVTARDE